MDESHAWLTQAVSDGEAAEREQKAAAWCHAVAKYQQVVEKAVKAVVAALHEARFTNRRVGPSHEVTPYMPLLVRLPRPREGKLIQQQLIKLLDPNTRARIRTLESLAPRWPAPGESPRRNTEYPFHDAEGNWTCPAAVGVFQPDEVEGFQGARPPHPLGSGANRLGTSAYTAITTNGRLPPHRRAWGGDQEVAGVRTQLRR